MTVRQSNRNFYQVIADAVNDLSRDGFFSIEQVTYWERRIREAAEQFLRPPHEMERILREAMASIYRKMIDHGGIAKYHPGVGRFTIDKIRPQLRAELDRRIMASAQLIRLNREKAIAQTIQRFSGWATSVPKGGSGAVDKAEERRNLKKGLQSLPFVERRVIIDQSAKFVSSLSDILAKDGGAIAAEWEHVHQAGYDGRPEHVARDGKIFLIRDSWAAKKGFVKRGANGYTDEIEQPAELISCRCRYRYLYSLADLPDDMLTVKGREALAEARQRVKEMA